MITLSKIAKAANVSVSTASKAFSGSSEVNEETRKMIFDIAKKYGCFKKFYNAKYPKYVIAIICPEFGSLYYTRYLSFLQKSLEKENCEICVAATNFSPDSEKSLLEYYYKYSEVDGIIVIGAKTAVTECNEIPVVFLNSIIEQNSSISISSNIKTALFESIDYLIKNNVDAIGFIGERLTDKKLNMFRQALNEKEIVLNESFISITEERFEAGGYSAMENLFLKKQLPRAVICAYDNMAIGAIKCIYNHGLTVPDDIAVLGMDDIPQTKFLNPPLASISIHTEEMCRIASQALIKQINGEYLKYNQVIDADFNLRKSFEIT